MVYAVRLSIILYILLEVAQVYKKHHRETRGYNSKFRSAADKSAGDTPKASYSQQKIKT